MMAGREEQKRREWHVEQAVSTAKRDLAVKVLASVQKHRPTTANGRLIQSDIHEDLCNLFATEGINVQQPTAPPTGE